MPHPSALNHHTYLSHWNALKFWGIPCGEQYFAAELEAADRTTHGTVFSRSHYYQRDGAKIHTCTLDVPASAKKKTHGQQVVSVEYAFLQVAYDLDMQRLILLGLLLTSRFEGDIKRQLTTTHMLKRFAQTMERHRGRRKALRALKYVRDRSRSDMEMHLYMQLALPHALGGMGLRGAVFDHRVKLGPQEKRALKKHQLFADLYYPSHRLVVEYNSNLHHSADHTQAYDLRRASILNTMGYAVQIIMTKQLYELLHWRTCVRNAARTLGKRIRIRAKSFMGAFRRLRRLLPNKSIAFDDSVDSRMDTAGFFKYFPLRVSPSTS